MSRPLYMVDLRHSRVDRCSRDRRVRDRQAERTSAYMLLQTQDLPEDSLQPRIPYRKDPYRTDLSRGSPQKPGLFRDSRIIAVPFHRTRFREGLYRRVHP